MISTKHRSQELEWLDVFLVTGEELSDTLDQFELIYKWLGGNDLVLQSVRELTHHSIVPIHIRDLGCGNGAMLRTLAKFGNKHGLNFHLIGIDANESAIQIARQKSIKYPNIKFISMNFFDEEFMDINYDIVIATFVFHHLSHDEILRLLKTLVQKAKIGIVINDLQRSKISYYLFKLLCLFMKNERAKHDGLISILRGFKKHELEKFSNQLNLQSIIRWKWAFRYQWLIKN